MTSRNCLTGSDSQRLIATNIHVLYWFSYWTVKNKQYHTRCFDLWTLKGSFLTCLTCQSLGLCLFPNPVTAGYWEMVFLSRYRRSVPAIQGDRSNRCNTHSHVLQQWPENKYGASQRGFLFKHPLWSLFFEEKNNI